MFLALICYFACNVAAGTFRIPRCRWANSGLIHLLPIIAVISVGSALL
jgi:hypothetical protein